MKNARLVDAADNRLLVPRLSVTESMWEATRGLLGRNSLDSGEGLLIPRCRFIHTVFMRFAIDLIYLNSRGEICRQVSSLAPWCFSACRSASSVLELPSGSLLRLELRAGQRCRLLDNPVDESLEWVT